MNAIHLEDVSVRFGATQAVDRLTALIPPGRFAALLGPSGCGKTTLLRLVAGLERPDAGAIRLGGRPVAGPGVFIGPEGRGLGMVFQSYALWPHMSVAGNVGFALSGLPRRQRQARVAEALAMVGLTALADRPPHALSGGQRQRVALARSLAPRPGILLLDEPLANLDAHLRQTMLAELRRLHAATGCTMLMVTHDQNEAMAVADLVGVMEAGRLQQIGPPQTLFDRPANPMVARFVGQGRTLPVDVVAAGAGGAAGWCRLRIGAAELTLPGEAGPGPGWLCLHARDLAPAPEGLAAQVSAARFEDGWQVADVLLDDLPEAGLLTLRIDRPARPGEAMRLAVRGGWVLPREAARGHGLGSPPAVPGRGPAMAGLATA